ISGNSVQGISVPYDTSTGNQILGNYIGTNVSGTGPLGNGNPGIDIRGATGNTIGGTTPAARNVVSANDAYGVYLYGAGGNVVQGNYIGTDTTGTVDLGNALVGVEILAQTSASNDNTIGG